MFRIECRRAGQEKGKYLEDYCSSPCEREDDGLNNGGSSRGSEKRSDSGCILK